MKNLIWFVFIILFTFEIFPQKIGKHTIDEWRNIIDTTWGAGLSTTEKLQVFDTFWDRVDKYWGGFPNLVVNWDSLRNYYRPIIQGGVSRGRFYGILSKLCLALNEWHALAIDLGIDSTMQLYFTNQDEWPHFPSFTYIPNIPLLNLNPTFYRSSFGAGLTALPDSTSLVYRVMPNHPLNLQPGDIILGYDGKPWLENLEELLELELPILFSGAFLSSSLESRYHSSLMCAGMNWGLFDTIYVLKYQSNDTLRYPTSLLSSITPPYFIATEQLPPQGVTLPDLNNDKLVSWGVVEGTNIGYIYVWDWLGIPMSTGETKILFEQAIDELMHQDNVNGLIIDFRTNLGGFPDYANGGFRHLFNEDPTSNYSPAIRAPGNDHFLFTILPTPPMYSKNFTPTPELFDHPIAVLNGPRAGSAGDYNAFRMRFHPMVRFFGKRTAGAFVYGNIDPGFTTNYYSFRVDNGSIFSNYNNEGFLIHKSFPVDEEVWLTRDGVANGKDDVVVRALEWINNKVYAHNTCTNKLSYTPNTDSIKLKTIIENPNLHILTVKASLHTIANQLVDSTYFINQSLTNTTDELTARLKPQSNEEFYKLTLKVIDATDSHQITIPNVTRFTTVGPLTLDSIRMVKGLTNYYNLRPFVRNEGTSLTISNAKIQLRCSDPWVSGIGWAVTLPSIAPGAAVGASSWIAVNYYDSIFPGYFNLKAEIMVDGWTYWVDSIRVNVITGVEEDLQRPLSFILEQNYPNPFNPTTTIGFGIPEKGNVRLSVLNILGEEIRILLNEEKEAGYHSVDFNAANLPSGVYLYKLQAGNFIDTKKMILLK